MELLRTITYQPAGGTKMCEQALGKAGGGDSKKKRAQQPPEDAQPTQAPGQTGAAPHHHHHHSHSAAEISRIIVDPTTGKRYCRGKVLGKVTDDWASGLRGTQRGGHRGRAAPEGFKRSPQIKSSTRAGRWRPRSLTCPSAGFCCALAASAGMGISFFQSCPSPAAPP